MTYIPINQKPLNEALAVDEVSISTRPSSYEHEVANGDRIGSSTINKFGYNLDVDIGTEVVASFGGSFNIMTTADTLNLVSTSATDDATGGTGATSIMIEGIDENYLYQLEIIAPAGLTPVTTVNQWLGVNRITVLASGTNQSNVGNITASDTAATFGTQGYIPIGESVTQQAIFHTQIGYNTYLDYVIANAYKVSGGGGVPRVTIEGISYSRVTDTYYKIFRKTIDTSLLNSIEVAPLQPFKLGGREVIYFTATTDINNTEVSLRFSGVEQLA